MTNLCATCEFANKQDKKYTVDGKVKCRCTNEDVVADTPDNPYYRAIECEHYLENFDDMLRDLLIITQADLIESQKKCIKDLEDQCDTYEVSQLQKEYE